MQVRLVHYNLALGGGAGIYWENRRWFQCLHQLLV